MQWIDITDRVPKTQGEYLVAVKNKNKDDGIWLFEVAFWNGERFERNSTWENILYWEEIKEPM